MDNIEHRVLGFIREHRLIAENDSVLLSLSAGKDSMALLHVLLGLRDRLPAELHIFHLNHMTRGAESDADAEFLAGIAARHGIPFHCEKFDVGGAKPAGRSFEEFAREVRYRMLRETAARENCRLAATAHSMDDSVETVIMRIFLGTGVHGLAGIEPRRGDIIRPLLCLESEEIYAHLRGRGIEWREDSSNLDARHLRNFVRREILPSLRERFPGCTRAVSGLSRAARDHELLLDGLISRLHGNIREVRPGGVAVVDPDRCGGNIPLLRYEIASAFRDLGAYVSAGMLDDIIRKLASKRGYVELFRGRGLRAVRTREKGRGAIVIAPDTGERSNGAWEITVDLSVLPARIEIPGAGLVLEFSWSDETRFLRERGDPAMAHIAIENADAVTVRNRRPGDRISLNGGTRKIKKLLIDQKLDSVSKSMVPLVLIGPAIALVMSAPLGGSSNRIADGFLVTTVPKKILAIRGFKN